MKKGVLIIGALVLSIGAVCLKAATPGEIELTKAIIEVERKAIVAINMQLDEKTAKTFWPLYNDYQNSLKKVTNQKVELLQSYAQDWRDLPEEKASLLLNQFIKIQGQEVRTRKKYVNKFRKSLTPKVVARFFQIENKLNAIVAYDVAQQVPLIH